MTDAAATAPRPAAVPATRHVVDGLAVTRRRPAEASGPTIVLVHGAVDRAASFGRTMRRLGDHDVIAYDRRGYAGSNGAGVSLTIADHAHDLANVIDWARPSSVVVVGHSLGGTIAAQLAATGQRGLQSIGVYESPFPSLDQSFDSVGGGAVELGRERGPAAAAEHFYKMMVGDAVWERLRDTDRSMRRAEGPALMAELEDLRRPEHAVELSHITVPVSIGIGAQSGRWLRSGSLLLADALSELGKQVRLDDIEGAGHGIHLSQPGVFADFVRTAAQAPG